MARSFATNQAITIDAGTVPGTSGGKYGIAVWARTTTVAAGTPRVFAIAEEPGNDWMMALGRSAAAVNFSHNNSSGTSKTVTGGTLTANQWHHIAAVWDGSELRAYLDGSSVGTPVSETTARTVVANLADSSIGAFYNFTTEYWSGDIAWVSWVTGDYFTAAEISAMAGGAHPLVVCGGKLTQFWPLYGSGSTEKEFFSGQAGTHRNSPGSAESPLVSLGGTWPANYTPAAGGGPVAFDSGIYYRTLLSGGHL